MGSGEQFRVVEFGLAGDDMCVGACRRNEIIVADELADPSPRHSAQVKQRDTPMPQECGENNGTPAAVQALASAVRNLSPVKPTKTGRPGTRSSRATSSMTA